MDISNILCVLNASFLSFLVLIDRQVFEQSKIICCRFCKAAMHSACRTRKLRLPRGVDAVEDYDKCFALCCSRDGCRKRFTPQSVRFAGRSPNLAILLIFAGFLKKGASEKKLSLLGKTFGVSERTLNRWKQLWQRIYATSKCWLELRITWALGKEKIAYLWEEKFSKKFVGAMGHIEFIRLCNPIFNEVSLCLSQ